MFSFLHDLDDLVIDIPLAGTYGSVIFADLILHDMAKLSMLSEDSLPEENNFAISHRYTGTLSTGK